MTKTATKRKLNPKSKAAQIRKLFEQGKLTPKQIGEKVGAPMPYVYVVRSKMKAEAGGLPSVSTKSPMPVPGGIQEVASEAEAQKPKFSPALTPARVVLDQPSFVERVKERIRAWFA